MKKILSIILALAIFVAYTNVKTANAESVPSFRGLNDPALPGYIEDTLYQELVQGLDSDQYFVENVTAIYISQEYIDELAYNSQANVFFGYTLAELDEQFQGEKYIFTLGENNETVVEPWTDYDDTYDRIIRNVAIGAGVILICVTVSYVTAGAGAPACSMIFAMAAKGGAIGGLSGAAFGGMSAGIVTGMETGDMEKALKAAALSGSENFKWGAICGAISGGTGEAIALKGATLNGLTMNQAAVIQRESGYPLSIIKEFHSIEEYRIYRAAGLRPQLVDGRIALIREMDLNKTDAFGQTNLQRMFSGKPPLDSDGISFEVHHVGQKNDSIFAVLTRSEHRGGGNFAKVHGNLRSSDVDHGAAFDALKKKFWKDLAKQLQGGI